MQTNHQALRPRSAPPGLNRDTLRASLDRLPRAEVSTDSVLLALGFLDAPATPRLLAGVLGEDTSDPQALAGVALALDRLCAERLVERDPQRERLVKLTERGRREERERRERLTARRRRREARA